ncbi:hypothetical protein [Planctomyces sp. SH-PL14]|uniref:hypothetical protein n=1 Tax=Planctomyces sp. SH-PL14 TaxID=1632864 RepID=UPI00078D39E4|nr:hypothetical protein [Planctomyces sp. SH-PL14]AMV18198.1 hypothetical protein VT03_09940 [Planctomyces sp. SH-PL14]
MDASIPGEICSGSVYTKEELIARAGWGKAAWLSAQKAGLQVQRRNRRAYVTGEAFISYINAAPTNEPVA